MSKENDKILDLILDKLKEVDQKFDEKIEKLTDEQKRMNETLIRQADSLDHHIERTNAIEAIVEPLHIESIKRKANKELIKKGLIKTFYLISIIGVLAAIAFGVLEFLV